MSTPTAVHSCSARACTPWRLSLAALANESRMVVCEGLLYFSWVHGYASVLALSFDRDTKDIQHSIILYSFPAAG